MVIFVYLAARRAYPPEGLNFCPKVLRAGVSMYHYYNKARGWLYKYFNKYVDFNSAKVFLAILTGIFVLIFEFLRHKLMHDIHMDLGNILVAIFSSMLFLLYFTFIFHLMQRLSTNLQKEKAHLAILSERDRIARSLHDNIAQILFFMNIKSNEIEKYLKKKQISIVALDELKKAIQHMDSEIRNNIFLLKEVKKQDIKPLHIAILSASHILTAEKLTQVEVNVDKTLDQALPAIIKQKIINILQELFINIKKYAQAKNVWVTLSSVGECVVLRVEDNGRGFTADSFNKKNAFGLQNITKDVESLAGKLVLSTGSGAAITIELPKELLNADSSFDCR
jgi:signal transduction histidine kinase